METTFECCVWGDGVAYVEDTGEPVYPDLCKCICHWPEDEHV